MASDHIPTTHQMTTALNSNVRARLLIRGRHLEFSTLGGNVVGIVVFGDCSLRHSFGRVGRFRPRQPDRDRRIDRAALGADRCWRRAITSRVTNDRSGIRRASQISHATEHRRPRRELSSAPQRAGDRLDGNHRRGHVRLPAGKSRTGAALDNRVLITEGRMATIDEILAVAVLSGVVLNAALGWWWADPAAGYVLVYYAVREAHGALTD